MSAPTPPVSGSPQPPPTSPTTTTDPVRWGHILLGLAAVAAAVTAVFVLRVVAVTFLDTRVFHEALEPAALFSVQAWRDGGLAAVYPTDWTTGTPPLILTPYPPLFHGLWLAVSGLLGGEGTYLPGRIIATVALLGVVALIYRIARQLGVSRGIAAVVAVIFLVPVPVFKWAGVARVDIPAIAFSLLGISLYLKYAKEDGYRFLWSAIPFVLAGLTKQSLIAGPAAIVLAEFVRRRYRRGVVFGAVTAGSVLAVFVALELATNGGFFNATVRSLADEIFVLVGVQVTADFLIGTPVTLMLSLLALAPFVLRRLETPTVYLYLVTSLAVLAMTVGKPGANVNYVIEPLAVLCIAGAVGLEQLRRRGTRYYLPATALMVACLGWTATQVIPEYRSVYRFKRAVMAQIADGIQLPADVLNAGPVLAPPWTYLMVREPRPVYYTNDDFTFSTMAAWGKLFSGDRVIEDLREHKIPAVIAARQILVDVQGSFIGDWQGGWHFWSAPGFRDALFEWYELSDRQLPLGLLLYLPKRSPGVGAQ